MVMFCGGDQPSAQLTGVSIYFLIGERGSAASTSTPA